MSITGQAQMTPELYRAGVKYLSRKNLMRIRLIAGVVILLAVLAYAVNPRELPVLPGLLVLVGLAFMFISPARALNVAVRNALPALGLWQYELTDDHLRVTTALSSTEWLWTSLHSVKEQPECWLLHTSLKNQGVIVLKAAFSHADQDAVRALLAGHVNPA